MKPFIYPVPEDLEVINLAQGPVYSKEQFYLPERFKPFVEHILLPEGLIQARWERLAERILADYASERELSMIVLMNGGYMFYQDLKDKIDE
mgnify:CR=1 FL=1